MSKHEAITAEIEKIQSLVDQLRETLQGISSTHVLYTVLLLELEMLETELHKAKQMLDS